MQITEDTVKDFLAKPYSYFAISYTVLFITGVFVRVGFVPLVVLAIFGSLITSAVIYFGHNIWLTGATLVLAVVFFYLFVHRLTNWKA